MLKVRSGFYLSGLFTPCLQYPSLEPSWSGPVQVAGITPVYLGAVKLLSTVWQLHGGSVMTICNMVFSDLCQQYEMKFVNYVYKFLVTCLLVVISYMAYIWIYIKYMTVKYMTYYCNLEGIFASGTYYSNNLVISNCIYNR